MRAIAWQLNLICHPPLRALCSRTENFDSVRVPEPDGGGAVAVGNPATAEFEVCRTTLLPSVRARPGLGGRRWSPGDAMRAITGLFEYSLCARHHPLLQALKTLGVNKKQELPIKLFEVCHQLREPGVPMEAVAAARTSTHDP